MIRPNPQSITAVTVGGTLSLGGATASAGATAAEPGTTESGVVALETVAQTGAVTSLVAALGILVLAILGGILVARNRMDEWIAIEPDRTADADEEFVTDRERVRQLITENGGRMKQAEIVDRVDWSKAKVSRLLADLESDGEITKLRLGRENLICLEGHEPPASKSPEQLGYD